MSKWLPAAVSQTNEIIIIRINKFPSFKATKHRIGKKRHKNGVHHKRNKSHFDVETGEMDGNNPRASSEICSISQPFVVAVIRTVSLPSTNPPTCFLQSDPSTILSLLISGEWSRSIVGQIMNLVSSSHSSQCHRLTLSVAYSHATRLISRAMGDPIISSRQGKRVEITS